MRTTKKIAVTVLWTLTTTVCLGKTLVGPRQYMQSLDFDADGKTPIESVVCIAWGTPVPDSEITVEWDTQDGDHGITKGCAMSPSVATAKNKFTLSHHTPRHVHARVVYSGPDTNTSVSTTALDAAGTPIPNEDSDGKYIKQGIGAQCDIDVINSLSFERIKSGLVLSKYITGAGQGMGTLTFQPDHYNNAGGTIVNGQSIISYDIAGLDWNPSLNKFETNFMNSPRKVELKPSGNLAPGTYTGKMVVTLTCD
ncbi:hypothetical protein ABEG91_22390 [Pantoea agglomerans]|uniref:hypothetical protein n=1 Tax=Enterobacter agglomerans TaxID=549 RepID=UPI003209ED74